MGAGICLLTVPHMQLAPSWLPIPQYPDTVTPRYYDTAIPTRPPFSLEYPRFIHAASAHLNHLNMLVGSYKPTV